MPDAHTNNTFTEAHAKVCKLIDHFSRYAEVKYLQPSYQEAEVRKDFIDPLLKALGWDVDHEHQHNPYEQEVKVESSLTVHNARAQKRADYAFYLAPNFKDVRFYVEAKKPSIDLNNSVDSYFQTLRYGYSAGTPLAVLTDFEQVIVLDCRRVPHPDSALQQAYKRWHYRDFCDAANFAEFYWLFAREAHADGSYSRRIEELPKPKGGAKQLRLFKQGYQPVDERFLLELAEYREALAKAFKKADISLDSSALTGLVQRTIDRLVFLRFLEDKQIETEVSVSDIGKSKNAWATFQFACRRLDGIYNGIVFKTLPRLDDKSFEVDADVFGDICERLAAENSPYNFDAIPIHILGSIYERFLGSIILATEKQVKIEEKHEVRKAGGVYYTPEYIVRHIVAQTVGNLIAGKSPAEIARMHFADIACGSGSFLLGIYEELLRYHAEWYSQPGYDKQAKKDGCIRTEEGHWQLSLAQRRNILQRNIYGVDLDRQAVEVAQLSLFLKLLEGERAFSKQQYLLAFARDTNMKKLLPDLSDNIVCGNSLVGWEAATMLALDAEQELALNPLDFEQAFPKAMHAGGFDAIVGNPPYLNIDDTWGKGDFRLRAIKITYPLIYNDKTDILFYFLARATQLSKGGVGYIVSRAFLQAFKADRLRLWLLQKTAVRRIVDFRNTLVFKGVGITTCIVDLAVGGKPGRIEVYKHRVKEPPDPPLDVALADQKQFEAMLVSQEVLSSAPWELTSSEDTGLNNIVDAAGQPLGEVLLVGKGMETGRNDVFGKRSLAEIQAWRVPKGFFSKRASNSDIQRYRIFDRGEYLLYPNFVDRFSELPSGVRTYLTEHASELKKRAAYKRGDCRWWQYTWPLHAEHYGNRKRILCPYMASGNRFAVDLCEEYIGLTDTTVLFDNGQPENLLYVLGLLNSRLLTFRFRSIGKLKGGGVYEYFWNSISRIPIRRIDFSVPSEKDLHDHLVHLVEEMLLATERATSASGITAEVAQRKCSALDRQIDKMVYGLYGLREDEIKLVEDW
jgi:type I restriction-modification system DNA methylase subunit